MTKPSTLTTTSTDRKDASSSSSTGSGKNENGTLSEKDEGQEFIDSVKKSYRKLSLKHHPDKSGGNVDTFRLLNRAQRVLLDHSLRKQYDLLGIDLDDDDDVTGNDHSANDSSDKDDKDHHGTSSSSSSSSPQGVLQEIASNILAGVLQLGVRTSTFFIYICDDMSGSCYTRSRRCCDLTLSLFFLILYTFVKSIIMILLHLVLLGVVSIVIVRYWFFVYPAYIFLLYTIYRMISLQQQQSKSNTSIGTVSIYDTIPTSCIAIGIFLMNRSITTSATGRTWTTQYWIGEGLVVAMFIYNSLSGVTIVQSLKPMIVWSVIGILSALIALWFRGNVWNYIIVLVIIGIVALLVAMAFPIMELIVEAILNEKLRKVGDKVRHHHQVLHTYYEKKFNNNSNSMR